MYAIRLKKPKFPPYLVMLKKGFYTREWASALITPSLSSAERYLREIKERSPEIDVEVISHERWKEIRNA